MTGIPLTRLETEETTRLLRMEDDIQKKVISQSEAIKRISEAVRRSRAGLEGSQAADRQLHLRRARPASAKPCSPRPWPSSCSATPTP